MSVNSWLNELKWKTKTAILKSHKDCVVLFTDHDETRSCLRHIDGRRRVMRWVSSWRATCRVLCSFSYSLWWWECHGVGWYKPYQENRFRVATALLAGEGIERMVWPASPPDLNPIPVGLAEAICISPHQRQQQPGSPVQSSAGSVECHSSVSPD